MINQSANHNNANNQGPQLTMGVSFALIFDFLRLI